MEAFLLRTDRTEDLGVVPQRSWLGLGIFLCLFVCELRLSARNGMQRLCCVLTSSESLFRSNTLDCLETDRTCVSGWISFRRRWRWRWLWWRLNPNIFYSSDDESSAGRGRGWLFSFVSKTPTVVAAHYDDGCRTVSDRVLHRISRKYVLVLLAICLSQLFFVVHQCNAISVERGWRIETRLPTRRRLWLARWIFYLT